MAVEVVMPRLGWTMETGRLVEWLKHDGEAVLAGEHVFVVETDKAAVEVEALDSGILRVPPNAPPEGSEIPVGAMLAYLLQPDEPVPWQSGAAAPPPQLDQDPPAFEAPGDEPHVTAPAPSAAIGPGADVRATAVNLPTISPRARRIAGELGVDWSGLQGSGRSGRIVERDVRAHAARGSAVRATPLARRVAQHAGVNLEQVAQTRPGKHISRADVEAFTPPATPAETTGPAAPPAGQPLSRVRRIIAARMVESARTTAPVTLTTEADASELVSLRNRVRSDRQTEPGHVPSYLDFVVRLTALALREHPALNASLSGDTLIEHAAVHIGIAVDTERGLLVPVVRDADRRSVEHIAAETASLIEAARAGKSAPDALGGSTFTITNLGMYEIDAFTPIINLPECAVLGLGRIVARPVVVDDQDTVAVRRMLALSLTFDHRIVDGAPAARFLQRVKQLVERPYLWIMR